MTLQKTTKKDFTDFQKEAKRWIQILGLTDWEVIFSHEPVDAFAQCCTNTEASSAILILSSEYDSDIRMCPKEAAFHEVCELLLARLDRMAKSWVNEYLVNERRHEVIQRLINAFYHKK